MHCSKCGVENLDSAQSCRSCGARLLPPLVSSADIVPKTSQRDIAAIVLGINSTAIINRHSGRLTGTVFAGTIVILVILLLLGGILMPALLKARRDSLRTACRNNLLSIGKAMVIYANDYEGAFPRAGNANSRWAMAIHDWQASNRFDAYGLTADGSRGDCTISSCFYLLVKYAEVMPESFICPGDSGVSEFNPAKYRKREAKLSDLWDFGPEPRKHCSYSYHQPFSLYPLTTSSHPGMAVAADRNPWIESLTRAAKTYPGLYNPDGGREAVRAGNAFQHQEDGQNVLFLDNHVGFEKQPFSGINDDNIYTYWDGGDIRKGGVPILGASQPMDKLDSFLVNDGRGAASGMPPVHRPKDNTKPLIDPKLLDM